MIKCFFVDVKNIKPQLPKSKFKKSEIEKLANLILQNDGLLRPLILKQTGVEKYTVIEGDLEYHAAVRAKEKDLAKAEMVNAFVIPKDFHKLAIEQIALLKNQPTPEPSLPIDDTSNLFEQLGSTLTAIVSQQLQPLQQELNTVIAELAIHKQLLASLSQQPKEANSKNDRQIEKEEFTDPIKEVVDRNIEPNIQILPNAKSTKPPNQKTDAQTIQKQVESQSSNSPDVLADRSPESKIEEPIIPASIENISSDNIKSASTKSQSRTHKSPISATIDKKLPTIEQTKPKIPATNSKTTSDPFASIDPEKLVKTLDLINTLNLTDLTLKMSKSGIGNTAAKLAINIVTSRDIQPEQKFDTWEEVLAKTSELKLATAKKVIEKLK